MPWRYYLTSPDPGVIGRGSVQHVGRHWIESRELQGGSSSVGSATASGAPEGSADSRLERSPCRPRRPSLRSIASSRSTCQPGSETSTIPTGRIAPGSDQQTRPAGRSRTRANRPDQISRAGTTAGLSRAAARPTSRSQTAEDRGRPYFDRSTGQVSPGHHSDQHGQPVRHDTLLSSRARPARTPEAGSPGSLSPDRLVAKLGQEDVIAIVMNGP